MLFFDFPVIFCAQGMLKNRVNTVKYTSQSFFAKLIFFSVLRKIMILETWHLNWVCVWILYKRDKTRENVEFFNSFLMIKILIIWTQTGNVCQRWVTNILTIFKKKCLSTIFFIFLIMAYLSFTLKIFFFFKS